MARPFESFEFMNRDRDVRKLEGLSLRSIFAYLLSMIFILGAGTGITAYAYFHNARRLDLSDVLPFAVIGLISIRNARLIYRRLGH